MNYIELINNNDACIEISIPVIDILLFEEEEGDDGGWIVPPKPSVLSECYQ